MTHTRWVPGQGGGETRSAEGRRGERPSALTIDEANSRKGLRATVRGGRMELSNDASQAMWQPLQLNSSFPGLNIEAIETILV